MNGYDDDFDGVQYDTFHGSSGGRRCVLCGETYPRSERLNDRNECVECVECVDSAEASWGF